jgi:hypothetical protein
MEWHVSVAALSRKTGKLIHGLTLCHRDGDASDRKQSLTRRERGGYKAAHITRSVLLVRHPRITSTR